MILAAAIPAKHGLQYYAFTILILALVLLACLKLIYWALNVWEKWRIIAHYRRQEKIERTSPQPSPQRGEGGAKKS